MVKENGALSDTSAVERIRKASMRGNAKSRRKNVISRDSFKGKNFLIFKFLAGQHDRTEFGDTRRGTIQGARRQSRLNQIPSKEAAVMLRHV